MKRENNFLQGGYQLGAGSLVGMFTTTAVTPIMNFTNHVINGTKLQPKRAFDGWGPYVTSIVPMVSISIFLNHLLKEKWRSIGTLDIKISLSIATVSGSCAGSVGSIFEAIAQAQQSMPQKPTAFKIIKDVYKNNGIFGLTRGMPATMIRQGGFTLGYLGLMPILTEVFREKFKQPIISDLFSAIICGAIVGPGTAPFNYLRSIKQRGFHLTAESPPSYFNIIKESPLMTGYKPRTLMTIISMFCLHKGNQLIQEYAPKINKIMG